MKTFTTSYARSNGKSISSEIVSGSTKTASYVKFIIRELDIPYRDTLSYISIGYSIYNQVSRSIKN